MALPVAKRPIACAETAPKHQTFSITFESFNLKPLPTKETNISNFQTPLPEPVGAASSIAKVLSGFIRRFVQLRNGQS
jgi:hypothetical protein